MRKMRTALAADLAVCALLSGCSAKSVQKNGDISVNDSTDEKPALVGIIPVSFPLTEKGATLNILATGYGGNDQENIFVWQKYEQMTSVDVNWTTVDKSSRAEAVHSALTNGQKLDIILR